MITDEELSKWKRAISDGTADYSDEMPPLYQFLDKYNEYLHAYRAGVLTKEQAGEKSIKAYRQYQNWQYLFDNYKKLCDEHQENLRQYREWLIGIDKAETMEQKFEYACRILSDVTGDRDIFRRNKGVTS